jgi:hypothetical protein
MHAGSSNSPSREALHAVSSSAMWLCPSST